MFLYPTKSVAKYQIHDKEVIVIGELHKSLSFEYEKNSNRILTPDFLYKQITSSEDTAVYLEIDPIEDINKRIEYYSYMNIFSKNLMDFITKIKNTSNGKKLSERIYGFDYRRIHPMFGQFAKNKLQDKFFNGLLSGIKLADLMTILNFVMFEITNWKKSGWNDFDKVIPGVINNLEEYFKYYDSQYNTFLNILKADGNIEITQINNYQMFTDRLMYFLSDFTDFFMLRDILSRNETRIFILVGENHASSLNKTLQQNMTYPPHNINDIPFNMKQKLGKNAKFLGKEVPKNSEQVMIRFL